MDSNDINITRFSKIISNIEPFYKDQHKEHEIETMKTMLQKASVNEVSALVCGEFKRGKSSFINAFLGEDVCPTDDGIATSVVSIIKYGNERKVTRIFGEIKNLQTETIPFEDIEKYAKGTTLEISNTLMLVIELPAKKLKDGLVLMDTPGVGGLDPRHLFLTLYVMPKADVTLFVVDAGEPLSSTELDFYKNKILQYSPSAKIILNKSDLKSKEELQQLIIDTKNKVNTYCGTENSSIDVIPVSSVHWGMFNKTNSNKFRISSNCDVINDLMNSIVPSFKLNMLKRLKEYIMKSLASYKERLEFQISQIEEPDEEKLATYKDELMTLRKTKDELSNPMSPTRKKISKVIHTTQSNVINELTRQSILFSTDGLNQLLERPEAKGINGGQWVLNQLNIGLETIAAEVDHRILLGFAEVNDILGEDIEDSGDSFTGKINADLTPIEKGLASKACAFTRNALPIMGVSLMAKMALSLVFGPLVCGLGAIAAGVGYVYKANKDQNIHAHIMELKTKLTPQITIVMNDLKSYVQRRFEDFNEALVDNIERMTSEIVSEMQLVIDELKNADADKKAADELKDEVRQRLNFVNVQIKQVGLLLSNPFS